MSIENVSNVSGERGNTKPSPHQPRNRSRRWCLTLNNYTKEEYNALCLNVSKISGVCIIGDEVGQEGTPHLQVYIEFVNQVDFSVIKKMCPRAHIEKAKGNRKQNIAYCSKEKVLRNDFPVDETKEEKIERQKAEKKAAIIQKRYKDVSWYPWQQNLIDIMDGPEDTRHIHWVWEPYGNKGKTFIHNYIYFKYICIIGAGKNADVAYKIADWQKNNDQKDPEAIILDIPRTNLDYVNYGMLEKFKDGLFSSPKYESCDVFFLNIPHVICYANEEPNYTSLSRDRWKIHKIE